MSDKIRDAQQKARTFARRSTTSSTAKAYVLGLCDLLDAALAQQPAPVAVPAVVREAVEAAFSESPGWRAKIAAAVRALPDVGDPAAPAPEAQEPVACPFCGESSGRHNQSFPHPREQAKAPPAAEQPDTVTELRDLMQRYFCALDRFDQEGPVSITVAAAKEAEALEKELRTLLAGGDKA